MLYRWLLGESQVEPASKRAAQPGLQCHLPGAYDLAYACNAFWQSITFHPISYLSLLETFLITGEWQALDELQMQMGNIIHAAIPEQLN